VIQGSGRRHAGERDVVEDDHDLLLEKTHFPRGGETVSRSYGSDGQLYSIGGSDRQSGQEPASLGL
jgi:hypothetical protein